MKTKKQKKLEVVYCLYINLTSNYISFKIEKGINLGKVKNGLIDGEYFTIEHPNDTVNYILKADIYKSENDALRGLVKILEKKLNIQTLK